MAADVQIHEMTAETTGVNKTDSTVRFKSADETSVDNENRIQVPDSGTTYSYTKQLRVYFNTAPAVDIQNLAAYMDGTNNFGTGVGCQYDVQASFSANVNTNINGSDLFAHDQNNPIDLDANNTGPHTGTGYKGDFLRLQLTVDSSASNGPLPAEALTVSYDES